MLAGKCFNHNNGQGEGQGEANAEIPRPDSQPESPPVLSFPQIKIRKALKLDHRGGNRAAMDVFTMTLDGETITLLPLKTWSQLDVFKWRVRGKLPGTPPGLEITPEHVKVAGEIVPTVDAAGCAQLERALNNWLATEQARLSSEALKPSEPIVEEAVPPDEPLRFEVEPDTAGQPHIKCYEGKEIVADVALTTVGLDSLITQGLIRKPAVWKIGALRDWIEMDGELFKFRADSSSLARFEDFLNQYYLPLPDPNSPPDVLVFANPGSTSGFDIQFPSIASGLAEARRRHMDPEALELLSDSFRCRILRKDVVVKLTPPNLIFKHKTADGGERPLEPVPDNVVCATGEDGRQKMIDLSQPVSHLGLQASDLTAIFNHPAVNRHAFRAKQEQLKAA